MKLTAFAMMRCLSFVVLLVLASVHSVDGVQVKAIKHMIIFNNGLEEPGKTCSASDWALVVQAVEAFSAKHNKRERGLRLGSRSLAFCKTCGPYCVYGGSSGCPIRRAARRLEEDGNPNQAERELAPPSTHKFSLPQMLKTCNDKIPALNASLNALKLAPSCAALVASRDIFCADEVEQCEITNVSLEGDVVVEQMPTANSTTFCQSKNVTFAANTQFFRGQVTFNVRNGANSTAATVLKYDKSPYYLLGTDSAGKKVTTRFAAGNYTLKVTSDYTPTLSTVVPFRVVNC